MASGLDRAAPLRARTECESRSDLLLIRRALYLWYPSQAVQARSSTWLLLHQVLLAFSRSLTHLLQYGMFGRLVHEWKDRMTPREVAEKVKRFHVSDRSAIERVIY